jgi:hypothetical protein
LRKKVPAGSSVNGEEVPIAADAAIGMVIATIVPGTVLKDESGDLKLTTSRPGFEVSTV